MAAAPYPSDLLNTMQWRFIGPFRGGRVDAVCGVPGDPVTFYSGSVGGGLWKTTNAGTTWVPIFDQQRIASIGAVAVAPSDPNVIYVGTGEADIRSQHGFGDGVYKSTDAGKTWRHIGLRDTRQIARILIDPKNPNLVYVGALGHVYGPNEERGVFRSTDGGQTWRKVLYKDSETGVADMAWDAADPKTIYATLWNARRTVWSQYAPLEGPGSGLWKTTDGGDNWKPVTGPGLPTAQWRRAGVAVASGGRRVYALIDAVAGAGLYRSDNAGENWMPVSTDARIVSRGWYFSAINVDPKNPDLVYIPNVAFYRSTDGGISFSILRGAPGGDDYHRLWIDPTEPRRMVLGTDQGTTISLDRGESWSTWYNQPTAQMYHAITDNRFPYTVYGSQQDSGTAAVPSRTDHGGIDARDWFSVGGGESGYIAVDPRNNNIFYVGNTSGSIVRFDRRTGESQNIIPWPLRSGRETSISAQKYRFPWTAPLIFSPIDPNALYYGSQYVLKTIDGGLTWKEISPDLTGDTRKEKTAPDTPPKPENARALGYGVVYAIAPSPLQAGLIWAGSDTGLIHVTRDGGATWQNVTPKGLPVWSKIAQLEASHFEPGTAYAAVDRHRMEDYKPYVYRTRDYGQTWTLAAAGLAEPAYLNGIREDPTRKGLLYAVTELDVAVSFDDGDHWQSLQRNLPAVSVRDLIVHGDDLVIATHGRGFWIMDNVSPLRQIDDRVTSAEALLFKPAAAIRLNPEPFFGTPLPVEEPKAKNPPEGALIDFYFKSSPAGETRLEILTAAGALVRRYSSQDAATPRRPVAIADIWLSDPPLFRPNAGMNRFPWDMRYGAPAEGVAGPLASPGVYTVRLTAGGKTYTQSLTVKLDPRSAATPLEISKQLELSLQCAKGLTRAAAIAAEVRNVQRQLSDRRQTAYAEVAKKIAELEYDATQIAGAAAGGRGGRGGRGGGDTGLGGATNAFTTALGVAQSADRTPPATAYTIYQQGARELAAQEAAWKRFRETDLPDLNRKLVEAKLAVIEVVTPTK